MERPYVSRNASDIALMRPDPCFSLDYEYNIHTGEPTIVGISDSQRTVSVNQSEGHPYILGLLERFPDAKWLGHNFIGAELEVWKKLGISIKPEQILDTIVFHYLTSMHLCKASKKASDGDGGARGRGFMNLASMCVLYTDCDVWKSCVGAEQCEEEDRPCPDHNPWKYNGEDTYWPLKAYPKMERIARMRGVDKLYPLHRDLMLVLQRVRERGVLIDVPYINSLRDKFESERKRLRTYFPFNPNSPNQVIDYFKIPDAQEQTIRDEVAKLGLDDVGIYDENGEISTPFLALPEKQQKLVLLLEDRELGKGPDRWFAPRYFDYDSGDWTGYVDEKDRIHCRLGIFTSTGRFNCTDPNLQNVSKRRRDRRTGESLGKRVRRAIIAPDGFYLYRADYKAAEYRTFLTLAGYRNIPDDMDFHIWMSKVMDIREDDPFAMSLGGPRDAAKSVMFGTIYLEGLKLVDPRELKRPRMLNEIAKGARLVFPEWIVFGKVVTFTGINLANRALGGASYENRAKALSYVQKIFAEFPDSRQLQMQITRNIEKDRAIRTPTGYVCLSYGQEEDRLKTGAAMHGSNPVAQFIKYAMIRADSHPILNEANVLSIHDENLWYVDARFDPKKVKGWIEEVMVFDLPEIPGLKIPIDVSYGRNWADQTEID